MTTVPMEYDASLSNTGVQVVPALVVFHTPPDATATYQMRLSRGWTAMSAMRPDVSAGPIDRSRRPLYGDGGPESERAPVVSRAPAAVRAVSARAVSPRALGRRAASRRRLSRAWRVVSRTCAESLMAGRATAAAMRSAAA